MRRDRPTFVITFEPLPRVDGVRVLRGLLKTALRRFGLRALDYREEHAVPTATQSGPWRGSDRAHTRATTEKTMDMRQYAGSSFVKFDDVRDGSIKGKITEVERGKFDRPVITLTGGAKLTLNATNVSTLIRALGEDFRDWVGHTVELYAGETKYQNEPRDSVLVRALTTPTPEQIAERATRKPPVPEMNDEIPF